MAQQPSFDFKSFNDLTGTLNTTMKLILARSLVQDVNATFARFDNDLQTDALALKIKLNSLIDEAKEQTKARREALAKREAEQERTTSDKLDNPTGEATHSTDVKDKYDQVAAAKADGVI